MQETIRQTLTLNNLDKIRFSMVCKGQFGLGGKDSACGGRGSFPSDGWKSGDSGLPGAAIELAPGGGSSNAVGCSESEC